MNCSYWANIFYDNIILNSQNPHTKIDQNCNNKYTGDSTALNTMGTPSVQVVQLYRQFIIYNWMEQWAYCKTWLSSYKKLYLYSNRRRKSFLNPFRRLLCHAHLPSEVNFCQVNVSTWSKAPYQGRIRVSNSLSEQLTTFAWRKLSIIKSDNSKPQHKPPLHFVFLPFNNR